MREAIRGHQRPSACNQQSTTPSRVPDEGNQCSHTICQIEARVLMRAISARIPSAKSRRASSNAMSASSPPLTGWHGKKSMQAAV